MFDIFLYSFWTFVLFGLLDLFLLTFASVWFFCLFLSMFVWECSSVCSPYLQEFIFFVLVILFSFLSLFYCKLFNCIFVRLFHLFLNCFVSVRLLLCLMFFWNLYLLASKTWFTTCFASLILLVDVVCLVCFWHCFEMIVWSFV